MIYVYSKEKTMKKKLYLRFSSYARWLLDLLPGITVPLKTCQDKKYIVTNFSTSNYFSKTSLK